MAMRAKASFNSGISGWRREIGLEDSVEVQFSRIGFPEANALGNHDCQNLSEA
jgi:hypothetical protein